MTRIRDAWRLLRGQAPEPAESRQVGTRQLDGSPCRGAPPEATDSLPEAAALIVDTLERLELRIEGTGAPGFVLDPVVRARDRVEAILRGQGLLDRAEEGWRLWH